MDEFFKALPALSGVQLLVAFVVALLVVMLVGSRHILAPGTAKLAAQQTERSEAIVVLERQISRADAKAAEQERRIERLEHERLQDTRYDQDYRHKMSNLAQVALAHLDLARMLLIRVEDLWPEMPHDIKTQIEQVPPARTLIENNPMPERQRTDP